MLVFLLNYLCFSKLLKLHQIEGRISSNLLKRKQFSRKTSIVCRLALISALRLDYIFLVNASSNATLDKRGSHVSYKYSNKDRPSFAVQVQPVDDAGSSSLHPLHMSRVISQIFLRDVVEIRKTGRSKITVEMRNYDAANKLVASEQLVAHKLRAFIPTFRVLRAGVIRDVPQDFSLEALRELTSSSIKILEFHRLNRQVKSDGEVKYPPSRTVCIKFADQFLPQ